MHRHLECMLYVKRGGSIRFSYPSGESKEVELQDGQILYEPHEVFHAAENIGNTEVQLLAVEFK